MIRGTVLGHHAQRCPTMATIEKRPSKDGIRYRVKVRIKGGAKRHRTFKRLTDAKSWASAVETDLGRGTYVATTAERRKTLSELIEKFVDEQLPVRRGDADNRNIKARLDWWKESGGYLTLERLTPAAIAGLRSKLLSRHARRPAGAPADVPAPLISPSTANRYLAALSAVCKWAWKELHWLPSNPVLAVTKGPEGTGIVRYLSDDERRALIQACKASEDPNIYCAVMLALATGARAGNLRMLRWDDVDLERWRLRFMQTKNREPRHVPVVGQAQTVLQAHFDRDATGKGWVFKGARDKVPADLDKPWRVVREAAGLVGEKHCRF